MVALAAVVWLGRCIARDLALDACPGHLEVRDLPLSEVERCSGNILTPSSLPQNMPQNTGRHMTGMSTQLSHINP